ncbi:MAG: aspartate--tRNA(Asn) ligase [candidate division WOR-3 bacterium]|nr:aspartate--tRNA(Asn) ligase [candidate division WOR-3 bacterium]MCX7757156.1 aspartate--tRNA(Asn) ligase [candidate division WOR-3 bacterium]MDW7988045.1 aspartate--tRNA(Asn) ligase [candidate division WOR-3 bacterium]
MNRVLVREIPQYIGNEVLLKGWVHQLRRLGKINFLLLRDRSGIVQTVILDPTIDLSKIDQESVVAIWGIPKKEAQAPGGIEVEVKRIELIEQAQSPLPFEVNRPLELLNIKLDTILDHRAFALRHPKINAIFKIEAELVHAFREFLRKEDFLEIHTSKIISQGTEGGTNLFPIQYFETQAYLAQSPQFYKQMMVGAGYERVFEVGFVYRAEDHATSRHINEYLSLDFEMGFIDSEKDIIDLEIRLLRYIFESIKKNCANELKLYEVDLPTIEFIPQIQFKEAREILKKYYRKELLTSDDLDPEAERLLCDYAQKEFNSEFIFVTNYPISARPFYTMPYDETYSRGFDLLYRGMEVTTGSQRIHNYQLLVNNMAKFGLNPQDFEFYLEIFRYGMPPHGGLAIGAERLTQQILGLKNIREASLFPRDRYRLVP